MIIESGINSFASELDLYNYLATRLNGDEFSYLAAIREAINEQGGIYNAAIEKAFDETRGQYISDVNNALSNSGNTVAFDMAFGDVVEEIYNQLESGNTAIQIKNQKALVLATQLIDSFDFVGHPTTSAQPLQWPRVGAIDKNGQPIPPDTIPTGIITATSELAFFLLKHDITDPKQHHHLFLLTSERVGESQVSFAKRVNKKLPDNIMDSLKPFLLEKSSFSSTMTF